jgi:hypothetical protein
MTTKIGSDKGSSTPFPTGTQDVEPKGLKDAASGVADEATRTLETTAARGMSQVGDVLHQVADAVRQSSETLQTEQPQVGRFIATAADKLDEAATFVSDREPTTLMSDAQDIARRQPALVIGGGLVAGLLIGRALKSAGSQPETGTSAGQDWYAAGYSGRAGDQMRDRTGVSSGYGTGYGASYDQSGRSGAERGDGSGHLVGVMSNGGSDPAEG